MILNWQNLFSFSIGFAHSLYNYPQMKRKKNVIASSTHTNMPDFAHIILPPRLAKHSSSANCTHAPLPLLLSIPCLQLHI